ncbi:hypothetical protein C5167_018883 [Papaver somniferum]|uniref:Uncharacterized protein n=1 Tax=Papaver somniferum TaxID=3469 RepID=A0A4Y7IRW0_PAPSO|nr:hypothetical protein C5167_018883 [Papaver somniferum]
MNTRFYLVNLISVGGRNGQSSKVRTGNIGYIVEHVGGMGSFGVVFQRNWRNSCNQEGKEEPYLNIVLEFVPNTVYGVAKHYSRVNQRMPLIYVNLHTYQVEEKVDTVDEGQPKTVSSEVYLTAIV